MPSQNSWNKSRGRGPFPPPRPPLFWRSWAFCVARPTHTTRAKDRTACRPPATPPFPAGQGTQASGVAGSGVPQGIALVRGGGASPPHHHTSHACADDPPRTRHSHAHPFPPHHYGTFTGREELPGSPTPLARKRPAVSIPRVHFPASLPSAAAATDDARHSTLDR